MLVKKIVGLLVLLTLVPLLPGAALSAPNWQTSVGETADGFELGLRDKDGDMAQAYTMVFVVKAPGGNEYRTQRAVPARHDNFVTVVFPRDFQGMLRPGAYVCQYLVNGRPVVTEKFTYQIVQGRGVIKNRQWL
jgi:hypothetical protein